MMMERLRFYYQEHAEQARQHESQRERMTNIVLAIAGALIGVVTFAELALWSLPAALAIAALGIYGLLFAQKHYERNRYHVYILREIRKEMDYASDIVPRPEGLPEKRTLEQIREAGVRSHYKKFTKNTENNRTGKKDVESAKDAKSAKDETTHISESSEARKDDLELLKSNSRFVCHVRVHKMWEGFHWLVFGLGLFISSVIIGKAFLPTGEPTPLKVELVQPDIGTPTQP